MYFLANISVVGVYLFEYLGVNLCILRVLYKLRIHFGEGLNPVNPPNTLTVSGEIVAIRLSKSIANIQRRGFKPIKCATFV